MTQKIKEYYRTVKSNAISSAFYDISKWLLGLLVVFIATNFLPKKLDVLNLLWMIIEIPLFWFIIIILSFIIITTIIISVFYLRIYNKLKLDHQTDELTGLKNDRTLNEYLSSVIDKSIHNQLSISLILLDIDNFSTFNDQIGYTKASIILSKIGQFLKNDSRYTDTTFRYHKAGDEFLVVLTKTNLVQAKMAAERKRKEIEELLIEIDQTPINVTVCCGITEFNFSNDTVDTFITRVEKALKDAKQQTGKNCIKTRL